MFNFLRKKRNQKIYDDYVKGLYERVGKQAIENVKDKLHEEALQYFINDQDVKELCADAFVDFDSEVWKEFLDVNDLELMYWFDFHDGDFDVVIQEV